MTTREAARKLGMNPTGLLQKWVKTHRLKPVEFKDKFSRRYLPRESVEALCELKEDVVTGEEAAKILGASQATITTLTETSRLKPVCRAGEDGFNHNLYLRSEVIKLRREEASTKKLAA